MKLKIWGGMLLVIVGLMMGTMKADAATLVLTEGSSGKTFTVKVGDTVNLKLKSNPSTGYSWTNLTNTSVLKLIGKGDIPANGMPGAGGYQYWKYKAAKRGTGILRLVYERSWENEPPDHYFKATIKVKK